MFERFSRDARGAVRTAVEEADRRHDRVVGNEHLLLGVLHEDDGPCARALGLRRADVRAALDRFDRDALRAVGIEVDVPAPTERRAYRRGRARLTGSARNTLRHGLTEVGREGGRRYESRHLLLGILDANPDDPALVLLRSLDSDLDHVRSTLRTA